MPDSSMIAVMRDWQIGLRPGLWGIAAGLLIFASMAYASGCALRRMPDFPEKAAMLRGARWGGPVICGLALLSFAVMWFGARFGLMMTSLIIGKGLFWTGVAILSQRYRLGTEGMMVGVPYWLRYRKLGPEKWIENLEKGRQKAERYNRALICVWLVLCGLYLAMGIWGYCIFDRPVIAYASDERLGLALKQELNNPQVVQVMPMHAHFEGPLYPLITYVLPQTSVERGRQIAGQMQSLLARRGEKSAMSIWVRLEHGHVLARAMYVPPGMVLPPGEERKHPRLRKW